MMLLNEKKKSQFRREGLVKKVNVNDVKITSIDRQDVDRINKRILIDVRQHEIERCNGLELAAQRYTH